MCSVEVLNILSVSVEFFGDTLVLLVRSWAKGSCLSEGRDNGAQELREGGRTAGGPKEKATGCGHKGVDRGAQWDVTPRLDATGP